MKYLIDMSLETRLRIGFILTAVILAASLLAHWTAPLWEPPAQPVTDTGMYHDEVDSYHLYTDHWKD